jgi:predicted DNA-binding transcriptional regulator AlpA
MFLDYHANPEVTEMSLEIESAPKLLVTQRVAAEQVLCISERTLWSLTQPRGPIPAIRIGRSVRYQLAELRRWVEQQQSAPREAAR